MLCARLPSIRYHPEFSFRLLLVVVQRRMRLRAHGSWKVMEFKIQIFPAWKVMANKPNGCGILDPCTCFWPLRTLSLHTVRQDQLRILCTGNC